MKLRHFLQTVVNQFESYPDDEVLTLGDWLESNDPAEPDLCFRGVFKIKVGDFRAWLNETNDS
jgi:hypothetical protein